MTMAGMKAKQENRLAVACVLQLLLVIGALVQTCQTAPMLNSRSLWQDDNNVPILESDCDPATGRCWGWLPVVDPRLEDFAVEEEFNRVQPIHVRNVDHVPAYVTDDIEAKNMLPVNSNPVANRLAKKDVFASRGWGAGGMPFSVLYMSPRANHPQPSGSTDSSKNTDQSKKNHNESAVAAAVASPLTSASAAAQTAARTNRVTPRNGGYNQPRRHYSIIPQLFISYGWGPSGK